MKKRTASRPEARRQRQQDEIKGALFALSANPNFAVFVDSVRDMRENAVAYLTSYTALQNEREYFAAVGEVRTCDLILEAHQQALITLMQEAEQQGPEPEAA